MNRLYLLSGIAVCLLSYACSKTDGPVHSTSSQNVTFFAAASTTDAVTELTRLFTEETGILIKTSFASSGDLANQIEQGAPCGVFLSANTKWAAYLDDNGFCAQRVELLGNALVIVVPRHSTQDIQTPDDLASGAIRRIALGDPDSVPAGIYAKQALTALDLWDKVRPKVVRAADVRQALMYVETGEADAGMVYSTDAALTDSVRVACEVDPALTAPIRYPMLLIQHEAVSPAARKLFEYMQGKQALGVFERFGFKRLLTAPSPEQ
ncbi:MAG: molybdate ABC transporter substrate-binding protein [bacterium]|nr:molybdate ABC transporter substrate-binding protein [bacterium]